MRTFGILTFIIGLFLALYAFSMDVSVEVNYFGDNSFGLSERVNNLGLMNQRQNYMIFSGVLLLGGIILLVFPKINNGNQKSPHKFIEFREIAERAEYRKEYSVAIDNYTNALYHLENDYRGISMSRSNEKDRKALILSLKKKVANLKSKIENDDQPNQ